MGSSLETNHELALSMQDQTIAPEVAIFGSQFSHDNEHCTLGALQ